MSSDDDVVEVPEVNPLWGHPYLTFPDGTEAHTRCAKLRLMTIGGHTAIDWPLLEELQEADRAREIIGVDTPWSRLFQICSEDSYRELVVEFISTFSFRRRPEGYVEDPRRPFREIRFRLTGRQWGMSLAQFAVLTGLYTDEEIGTALYTEGVTELDRQTVVSFWMVIARRPFGASQQTASAITDPLYRYLHHIIASSITARHFSREKVNRSDLFFLYCLLMGRTCALAESLAMYFSTAYHRQARGWLYGGAFVTVIARGLGIDLDDDPHLSPPIPSTTFGRASLHSMRVLRQFPQGLRFRTRDHQLFVPVPLPAPGDIPVFHELGPGIPAPDQHVVQPPPDAPPPPPPAPQPQQPPQYPHHIYEDLPPAARLVAQDFDRRLRRHDRILQWAVSQLQAIAAATGAVAVPLPPSPPPEGDEADDHGDEGH